MRFWITARLNVHLNPEDILVRFGLERGGRVQQIIDQRVIDYSRRYIPASPNRILENSAQPSTEIGSGEVIYNTPYARYQYYGHVMTDEAGRTWVGPGERKPIVHEDWPLHYDTAQNKLAGAYFFERSKADNCKKWVEGVNRVAKQGE